MKAVTLRPMTEEDLAAADELRQLAGWNQTSEDWRRLLWLEPHGCFVAACESGVIGTVTTTTYGQTLAWIGMMLVHADFRGQGFGTRLIQRALEYLQTRGVRCVRLDATPAGRPVYQKLGFLSEGTLTRCQRPAKGESVFPETAFTEARNLSGEDWTRVDEIDTAAFGLPRPRLIRSLAHHSRSALVWPNQGRVLGWGMLRPGANADYFGPAACSSTEGLLSLSRGLLHAAGNRPVIWDIPDQNEAAKSTAERFGFAAVRPLTRMRFGPDLVMSDPGSQFAIADPAVG